MGSVTLTLTAVNVELNPYRRERVSEHPHSRTSSHPSQMHSSSRVDLDQNSADPWTVQHPHRGREGRGREEDEDRDLYAELEEMDDDSNPAGLT
jgi:hypothetical protein